MKTLRTSLITASLLLSLGSLAMAQTAMPKHEGHGAMANSSMHARMEARHAQHLADLKGKLKLEASQEVAWNSFSQSMQLPAQHGTPPDRAALEKLTTPERLDMIQAHKAQRDSQMQKHIEATKSFYAALNAEQKKIFDAETARAMKRMGGEMQGMKHGGGHHH